MTCRAGFEEEEVADTDARAAAAELGGSALSTTTPTLPSPAISGASKSWVWKQQAKCTPWLFDGVGDVL